MKSWFTCRAAGPKRGEIGIYDDIGGFGISAKDFLAELKGLGQLDDLVISINSGGGDVFDGLAIYNALLRLSARITTRVQGIAASIASVIAMAGDEIEMPPAAFLMIHDPSALVVGRATEMERMAETLRNIKRSLVGIYATRSNLDSEEIERLMEEETWMDGHDAVSKGFATRLIDAPAMAASLDLSKFSRVPDRVRALHPSAKEVSMHDDNQHPPAVEEKQPVTIEKKKDRASLVNELAESRLSELKETLKETETRPVKVPEAQVDEQERISREALRIANERTKRVQDAYASGSVLGLTNEVDRLLNEGVDPIDIPGILIQINARLEQRKAAVGGAIPSGIAAGFSWEDPKVAVSRMSDAIAAQYIPGGLAKVPDAAREYMTYKAQDFMRSLLERRGTDTRRMTRSEIVDAALHTTSDFPNLLGTSANKIFLGSYEAAPATFRDVMGRVDLSNFQLHNMLRDGDFPTLAKVLESGEFTYGSISESNETAQLATYGRTFAISRHALINDSLGVFGRMTAKIGQAVARFENSTAWGVVTANGNTSDGVAFFAAAAWPTGHANYTTSSGTAISATSLGVGRSKMRLQKSLDGQTLNIAPAYLVVPATKETVAEQILYPTSTVTSAADVATQSQRSLQLIVEPLLDAVATIGTTAWYLFASPAQGAAFVYGYLEGDTAPRVRVNDPFNVDGIEFQVRLDFHAAAVDPRFAYLNTGA